MKDLTELGQELKNGPKGRVLSAIAESEEGKRLSAMLDPEKVERAAQRGDTQELQSILRQVLSTPDGQKLAKKLAQAMK